MRKTTLILSIIFAMFISIFAFDEVGHSVIGFLIHLIPTYLIVIAILISKRHPLIGAILFGILSVASALFFKTYRDIVVFMIVSLPFAIISIMLYLDVLKKGSQNNS